MTNQDRLIVNCPPASPVAIILAHGAGAGMDTDFMNAFAEDLAGHGFRVVRFEFPYMAERRLTGKRRPPDREPVLRQTWLDVIASIEAETLIIGGKSLGGRIASLIADEAEAAGLVCLGYPFHPTGKPDQLRVEHLQAIQTPTLILQGERDPFGNAEEVRGYRLSSQIRLHWLPDGDHSFKPRASSGRTQEENWQEAIEAIAGFVRQRSG
jgi:predicted alpha/beta-hydrolase family hydrolase